MKRARIKIRRGTYIIPIHGSVKILPGEDGNIILLGKKNAVVLVENWKMKVRKDDKNGELYWCRIKE